MQRVTWNPGARAAWVDDANAGLIPEMRPRPELFDAGRLLSEAVGRHRGDGEPDAGIDEPLRILCEGLESTAALTPLGRWATQRYLDRLLDVHLDLAHHAAGDAVDASREIDNPVFVIGAPRTGTTALHRLLAADHRHRVPTGWEFLFPLPPPEPDTADTDPRIDLAAAELTYPQSVSSGLRTIHTYSATMPKECLSAMSFAFRSEEFISRYELPAYVEWLGSCDMAPAYGTHRRVLQVLQERMPARRWVLKSPVHLQAMAELAATYPDATYVVTHRDPADVLASVTSLIATMRAAFSDEVDAVAIGAYHLDLYSRSLGQLVEHDTSGLLPPDRTVHVAHADIVGDPDRVLAQVYATLGYDLDDATSEAVRSVLSEEREDKVGAHQYDFDDFGLDRDAVGEAFAPYRARFLEDR